MIKHKKHSNLTKPIGGKFGKNEFAILGAPCSIIQKLSRDISDKLSSKYNIAFIDESHKKEEDENKSTFSFDYILNQEGESIKQNFSSNSYQLKAKLSQIDLTLINGNHFAAEQQIVIINSDKKDSLKRKLDRLSNIQLILLDENENVPFDFIEELVDSQTKILSITETNKITDFLEAHLIEARPKLNGLVLMGGKSSRMGEDKSKIVYHQKQQSERLYDSLNTLCDQTFLSLSNTNEDISLPYIKDALIGLGPFGAILSAFQKHPNEAWLVVACDLPLLKNTDLEHLVKQRNTSKIATAFYNPATDFPEPLITIWEPKAYPILLQYLAIGYSCPRKVLINSDVEIVEIDNPNNLTNANTPEERAWAMSKIKKN